MAEVWPAGLPQIPLLEGLAEGTGEGRLASQADHGPAKLRPLTSAIGDPLAATIAVSTAGKAILKTFVETTLIGGTLAFTFPDPDGGADLLARFATLPVYRKRGPGTWFVGLDLEILP